MAKKKTAKPELTKFQKQLLKNMIGGRHLLRHGHSDPVHQMLEMGLIERVGPEFIPTDAAKNLDL